MMDVQDGIGKLVNGLGRVRECGRADKERVWEFSFAKLFCIMKSAGAKKQFRKLVSGKRISLVQ